jgi:hypothetical protein
MKLGRNIFSFVAAPAAAIILLGSAGVAQEPGSEQRGHSGYADRLVASKPPAINAEQQGHPPPRFEAIKSLSGASASIFPADIFASATRPLKFEALYPANSRHLMTSKDADKPNDDELAALAKHLRNPVSPLARFSARSSFDIRLAADREGWRHTIDFEPVIPIRLSKDWNIISRTKLPLIQQDGVSMSTEQTGLGDMLQSLFLSPNKTEPLFWGAGTALLVPTATDTRLGAGKLGIGPAVVIGKHQHGWTYGAVAHQIWSVSDHSDRPNVRSTHVQPFLAYTAPSAWTYSLDTDATYDWVGKRWSLPIHLEVAKVIGFGRQPVSVGAAVRCWAASPPGGPQPCGVRFIVTPLFPSR